MSLDEKLLSSGLANDTEQDYDQQTSQGAYEPSGYDEQEQHHHHGKPTAATTTEFESLDYDRIENASFREKFVGSSTKQFHELHKQVKSYNLWRWIMCGIIGCLTALVAFFIDYCTKHIIQQKFIAISSLVDGCLREGESHKEADSCLWGPWAALASINCSMVFIASALVVLFAPSAAGSGIPEIKCTLNGVKRKGWITIHTLVVKVTGVLFSVSATMPVGKEGPMIHSGAIIGGGIPQAKSTRLGIDIGKTMFRSDRAKRDFVSVGAAAGVSAAFGAPLGGVLFALEEGASFWNQALTWRTLFCTSCALFVLHIFQSGTVRSHQGNGFGSGLISSGGLLDFGNFDDFKRHCVFDEINTLDATELANLDSLPFDVACETALWRIQDLISFSIMALGGGLLGAAWNSLQMFVTRARRKIITSKPRMVAEAMMICLVNTSMMYLGAMYWGHCQQKTSIYPESVKEDDLHSYFCQPNEYNDMASLAFNPLDAAIKILLHSDDNFELSSCVAFFLLMAFTSCWTYGLKIPSGLFVPALVTGAAYGRFWGEIVHRYIDGGSYRGSYALIGAAAFLGGVVRMTISLTVILVEATNEVTYGLPIVLTLLIAKWVGDYFNIGIYDAHIFFNKIPLLEWEAEEEMKRYLAEDVMTKDVKCVRPVCRLSDVVQLLKDCAHNGFPVIQPLDGKTDYVPVREGQFEGLILRHQIITMLQNECWGRLIGSTTDQPSLPHTAFLAKYPQRTPIDKVHIPPNSDELYIDFSPFMNPSMYFVTPNTPLPRIFNLYRTMGLRHIPVLDKSFHIAGIITRAELTAYKIHELDHEFEHREAMYESHA